MSWALATIDGRDMGWGVPAECDHPNCKTEINRGLSYVCGSSALGGTHGCGLFFCKEHLLFSTLFKVRLCERCEASQPAFTEKPDIAEWLRHKLTDPSWSQWRKVNPEKVAEMKQLLDSEQ